VLFVKVTPTEPLLRVSVTEAGEDAPGSAKASGWRVSADGSLTWIECRVSSDRPETEVVLAPVSWGWEW
jgi:hypothetical protein